MVDIAQLVSASDCGSEGRGFESHYPPHKNNRYSLSAGCFYENKGPWEAVRNYGGRMELAADGSGGRHGAGFRKMSATGEK